MNHAWCFEDLQVLRIVASDAHMFCGWTVGIYVSYDDDTDWQKIPDCETQMTAETCRFH